jgi:alcohol dehydrogenase (cytochrome c)
MKGIMRRNVLLLLALVVVAAQSIDAQVSNARLLNAAKEPQNWLTYSGTYDNQRHSLLKTITPANAKNLELKWVYQTFSTWSFETTPLVVDGVMYLTSGPNDVTAIDAATGRPFWIFKYTPQAGFKACCGSPNRGVAILGDTLFMGTVDAHLIALDAVTGRVRWNTTVAKTADGYAISHAPLVIKDKVIVGTAGGEYPTRGFIAAYDVHTGKEAWRFYTIPGTGEPGNDTWPADAWQHGGGSVWTTGAYDPALNLTYWGVGNANPNFFDEKRKGDNLYTCAVVALDADTGKLKWHFQFTPHDINDWDAAQVGVLADMNWLGTPRKVLMWANRNGFFYVLDRETGAFLKGFPYVKVNWASGLDHHGRPILTMPPVGELVYPWPGGGTSWFSPSFSPRTELMYVTTEENTASRMKPTDKEPDLKIGQTRIGGNFTPLNDAPNPGVGGGIRAPVITNGTETNGTGAVSAIDPRTGVTKWKFPFTNISNSGLLTTASDLVFSGSREGHFFALDARTGSELWRSNLGGHVNAGPMTYSVDGKQFVAIAAGQALFVFGLRE